MESAFFIKFVSIMTTLLVVAIGSFLAGAWLSVSKIKRLRELPESMRIGPMIGGGLILPSVIFFFLDVILFIYYMVILNDRSSTSLIIAAIALVVGTVGLILMYPQRTKVSTFFILLGSEVIAIILMWITCASCDFGAIYYFFFLLILGPLVLIASNIFISLLRFLHHNTGLKVTREQ
jgi:hypothetical protein